jgi:hypothetical protein
VHAVAGGAQAQRAHGVDRQTPLHPGLEARRVALVEGPAVAAGQDGDGGPCRQRRVEHPVGERAAGVHPHDQLVRVGRYSPQVAPRPVLPAHRAGEAGPARYERRLEPLGAGRLPAVDAARLRCGGVEEQQQPGDQPVARGQLQDGPAPHAAAHAAGHLPGLEQLLAGEAVGLAHDSADGVEQRVAGELRQGAGG